MQNNNYFYQIMFPLIIIFASLFLNVGYSAMNSVTGEIKGEIKAKVQDGIFISDVIYSSSVNASNSESIINSYYQTMLNSKITLGNSTNSSITYNVTVYNNSNSNLVYFDTTYDQEFYDNFNIVYSVNGINKGTIVNIGESLTFSVTFSYKDNVIAINNTLNSYINFNFKKIYSISYNNILLSDVINYNYPTSVFEGSSINANYNATIRNIKVFMGGKELIWGTDYTYNNNGSFTLNNVIGDVIVEMIPAIRVNTGNNGKYLQGDSFPGGGSLLKEEWIGHHFIATIGVFSNGSGSGTYSYSLNITNISGELWFFPGTSDKVIDAGGVGGTKAISSYSSSTSAWIVGNNKNLGISFNINYNVTSNPTATAESIVDAGNDTFYVTFKFVPMP